MLRTGLNPAPHGHWPIPIGLGLDSILQSGCELLRLARSLAASNSSISRRINVRTFRHAQGMVGARSLSPHDRSLSFFSSSLSNYFQIRFDSKFTPAGGPDLAAIQRARRNGYGVPHERRIRKKVNSPARANCKGTGERRDEKSCAHARVIPFHWLYTNSLSMSVYMFAASYSKSRRTDVPAPDARSPEPITTITK